MPPLGEAKPANGMQTHLQAVATLMLDRCARRQSSNAYYPCLWPVPSSVCASLQVEGVKVSEQLSTDRQTDRCTMTIGASLRCNTRQSDGPLHVGCCSPLLRRVQRASLTEEGREHAANLARLS